MIKAVVLISGGGSNLQAIIDQIALHKWPVSIKLVVSNVAGAFGLERAKRAAIKTAYVDNRAFSTRLAFDLALIDQIDRAEPDLIILAGFMRILTPEFVNHYRDRLINIHPSLLPKHPGTNTHQRAIDAQDQLHGASIHFVVAEVDAGPIILQGQLVIQAHESAEQLQARVLGIEHHLYPLAVKWFAEQRLTIEDEQVLLDGKKSEQQIQTFNG